MRPQHDRTWSYYPTGRPPQPPYLISHELTPGYDTLHVDYVEYARWTGGQYGELEERADMVRHYASGEVHEFKLTKRRFL